MKQYLAEQTNFRVSFNRTIKIVELAKFNTMMTLEETRRESDLLVDYKSGCGSGAPVPLRENDSRLWGSKFS